MFLSSEKMLPATGQGRDSFAQQVRDAVDAFYVHYADQADYVSYFQRQWETRQVDLPYLFNNLPLMFRMCIRVL